MRAKLLSANRFMLTRCCLVLSMFAIASNGLMFAQESATDGSIAEELQIEHAAQVEPKENGSAAQLMTLKEAAEGLFEIGVGTSLQAMGGEAETEMVAGQFGYLTPENCMKPAAMMNEPGVMKFGQCDAYFDFAARNELKVVGHCLVWAKDNRTPPWFYLDPSETDADKKASREVLLARMRDYINTMIGRYGDRVDHWDVVNEALDDGPEIWRPSGWQEAFGGPEFIVEAFKAAHKADPTATLIYNDYRSELDSKRPDLLALMDYLLENDTPVHAIGLQGHYELDEVPYEELELTLNEIRKRGLKVMISEIDIDIVKRGKWWAEGGKFREELKSYDPYADGCPDEILQRQAEQYGRLFEIYARNSDIIERVTFWGLHDGQSWLNHYPWERANYVLLFDRQLQTKPAYDAVINALIEYNENRN